MRKCLRITLSGDYPESFLRDFVQKHARSFSLEGTGHRSDDGSLKISVCGDKDNIDAFLDLLHKGTKEVLPEEVSIEPFVKEKDYRGIFRVIE